MSAFRVEVWSNPEYDDLIAEIYYGDKSIGVISQEDGYSLLNIGLERSGPSDLVRFKLAEFEAAIALAKERLWELRRADPTC